MGDIFGGQPPALVGLPQYRCHKVVGAAKIASIEYRPGGDVYDLKLDGSDYVHTVDKGWLKGKKVSVGGYLVQYDDGYFSFSPSEQFERGYTRL